MKGDQLQEDASAQLKRRVADLEAELTRSETARRELLQSNSWRLTRPLRWVKKFVTRVRASTAPVQPSESGTPGIPHAIASIPVDLREPVVLTSLYGSNQPFRVLRLEGAVDKVAPSPDAGVIEARQAEGTEDLFLGDSVNPQARIGLVGSRELARELAFDACVRLLRAGGWQEQLEAAPLDFVLIETAWEPAGGWRYGLRGVGQEAQELLRLLAHASNAGLPTVLWVRDAPDAASCFRWLLPHVEAVYAADGETASRLSAGEAKFRVQALLPAIQPRLHHPVRTNSLRQAAPLFAKKILFDGWWDLVDAAGVDPVLEQLAADQLLVVDSEWEVGGVRIPDLPLYQQAMVGCVSEREKSGLSKVVPLEYQAGTSLSPPWQRAQQALRAAACGAVVVGAPSASVWGDIPSILGPEAKPLAAISGLLSDPLERMRIAHRGFRAIMSGHRYSDRISTIMRDLGLNSPLEERPAIVVVLVTMRPERLADALAYYRAQDYPSRELVLVLHGGGGELGAVRRTLRDGERAYSLGRERSLGDCLNFAIAQSDAPYWAKIDDDDHYGPSYLSDLMLYRHTVPAQVWGKPPMFLHSQADDDLSWDPVWAEHANLLHHADEATHALVAGGTLAGRREVLEAVRFSPRRRAGSDSEFVRQCYANGISVLATDGFNFARFRGADPRLHTWRASMSELRTRTLKIGTGSDVGRLAFV